MGILVNEKRYAVLGYCMRSSRYSARATESCKQVLALEIEKLVDRLQSKINLAKQSKLTNYPAE